jgi:hypothetical protein
VETRSLVILAIAAGGLSGAVSGSLTGPSSSDLAATRAAWERLEARIGQLEESLDRVNRELAAARAEIEQWKRRVEGEVVAASAREEGGAPLPADRPTIGREPSPPGGSREALAASFARLASGGFLAVQGPLGAEVLEQLRALGEAGIAFLAEELASESDERRFAAAAIAERLADPALIEPLTAAALDDEAFIVRRMASHALALMGNESAGDALVEVLAAETRDAGVRLNAWYGLATLGRKEAIERFGELLDSSGGEITADFVVDTALKVEDPRLYPALRAAYDHSAVTDGLRIAILRTLARDESGVWRDFIRAVATDEKTPAAVREVARTLEG